MVYLKQARHNSISASMSMSNIIYWQPLDRHKERHVYLKEAQKGNRAISVSSIS